MSNGNPDHRGAESAEMSRWQGGVDATLIEHGRRLNAINGDAKAAHESSKRIEVELAVLKTKIAIWSGLGGLTGAGIVSLVIALLTGDLSGGGK